MDFNTLKELIKADYARVNAARPTKSRIKAAIRIFSNESFSASFWFRVGTYLRQKNNIFAKCGMIPVNVINYLVQHHTGIQIPIGTRIGGGYKIPSLSVHCNQRDSKNREELLHLSGCDDRQDFFRERPGAHNR